VPDLGHREALRVEAGGYGGQAGGGPGHHPGRPGERAQVQQLAVHDGRQHQRGDLRAAGDEAGQSVEAGRDHRVGHRPAQFGFGHDVARGEHVQPGECLPGGLRPEVAQPGQRPGHP
jgi:hypothetical protein